MSAWIRVDHRLPERGVRVLWFITYDWCDDRPPEEMVIIGGLGEDDPTIVIVDNNDLDYQVGRDATHWMPLPGRPDE